MSHNRRGSFTREQRLEIALRDLLEQVDCLQDIEFGDYAPIWEIETTWNDTLNRARKVLSETPESSPS